MLSTLGYVYASLCSESVDCVAQINAISAPTLLVWGLGNYKKQRRFSARGGWERLYGYRPSILYVFYQCT